MSISSTSERGWVRYSDYAALEAQVKMLREAGAAVLPFDRSYAYSGRRRAFDQLREAIAATEPQ